MEILKGLLGHKQLSTKSTDMTRNFRYIYFSTLTLMKLFYEILKKYPVIYKLIKMKIVALNARYLTGL